MTNSSAKYVVYMLRLLPPGIFGEAYAICTGTESSPGQYRAEHFILMQRPSEALHIGTPIVFDSSKFPAELGAIDIDFAITEANRQAEIDLQLLLEKRATELQRPDLAYLPFDLQPRPGSLLSCWMRGRFNEQLNAINRSTKCPSLQSYLGLLQQNSVVGPPR